MTTIEDVKGHFELASSMLFDSVQADNTGKHEDALTLVGQAYDVIRQADLFDKDVVYFAHWYKAYKADFLYCLSVVQNLEDDMRVFQFADFEPDEYANAQDMVSKMKTAVTNSETGKATEIPVTVIIG